MSTEEPSVINSFSDVLAAWNSWGRCAFFMARRWCLQGAWWEVGPRPRKGCCSCCCWCPSVHCLLPPWAVSQSCGLDWTGRQSAWAHGASSPLQQISQDCKRRTVLFIVRRWLHGWKVKGQALSNRCTLNQLLWIQTAVNFRPLYSAQF